MKVLFLLDMVEDFRHGKSFSFAKNGDQHLIKDVLDSYTGYIKVGDSVQSHASMDPETYILLGGVEEHQELLTEFLDDHTEWTNLGMDFTAFFEHEKAILLNSDSMHYTVWAPAT